MQKTDLEDGSTSPVRSESQVHPGYSRLEGRAQGVLFVLLGGLFMTLVVISALAFGL